VAEAVIGGEGKKGCEARRKAGREAHGRRGQVMERIERYKQREPPAMHYRVL
jgi:hypothetical protein